MNQPSEPYESCPENLFRALLWLSVAVAFFVRLQQPELTWFSTDMSRDLARSFEWLDGSPTSYLGPEIGHGPRMPGPAYYWFLALAWLCTHSIPGMLTLIHFGILCLSIWFLFTVVRPLGRTPTLLFWLTFALLPTQVLCSRMLWSPSLVVSLNLVCLICFKKFLDTRHQKWLVLLGLLAVLAVQIHLTALAGPLVCLVCASLMLRRWTPLLGLLLTLLAYLGAVWGSQHILRMGEVVRRDYGLLPVLGEESYRWANFSHSLSPHLFITEEPLRWDELYTVTFRLGPKVLAPATFAWVQRVPLIKFPLAVVVLGGCLFLLWRALRRRSTPLEQALLFWTTVAVGALASYKFGRGTVPYRYGFSFYPLQFLVPALALSLLNRSPDFRRWARPVNLSALLIALLVFAGNAFFLLQTYRVSELTGRASETAVLDELHLGAKLRLVKSAGPAQAESYLATLHGPVANRVRRAEFYHWTQRRWSGGLYQSLERTGALSQDASQHTYLNLEQGRPQLVPLAAQDLPTDVSFEYRDENATVIATLLPNSQNLLPCLRAPDEARTIRVSFTLPGSDQGPIAICFDDHPLNRALAVIENSLRVNGRPFKYSTVAPGRLNQRVLVLEHPQALECELEFQLVQHGTYSRLDIFRLPESTSIR